MSIQELPWNKGQINGLTKAIPFLLASLEGGVNEYQLLSVSLQRVDNGSFRCVLRGYERTGEGSSVRTISFSNGELAAECLLYAETGFRDATIRWHIDQYAKGSNDDVSDKTRRQRLTLV